MAAIASVSAVRLAGAGRHLSCSDDDVRRRRSRTSAPTSGWCDSTEVTRLAANEWITIMSVDTASGDAYRLDPTLRWSLEEHGADLVNREVVAARGPPLA